MKWSHRESDLIFYVFHGAWGLMIIGKNKRVTEQKGGFYLIQWGKFLFDPWITKLTQTWKLSLQILEVQIDDPLCAPPTLFSLNIYTTYS